MRLDARAAITCREYIHKSFAPKRFNLSNRDPQSPVAEAMAAQGLIHEARVIEKLKATGVSYIEIDENTRPEVREELTVDALRNPEIRLIIHPVFGERAEDLISETTGYEISDRVRSSRPDLLVRQGIAPAPFGTWSAVDVKSHGATEESKSNVVQLVSITELTSSDEWVSGRLKQDDAMQLAHYQRHLEAMGIADPEARAGIIGRDVDRIVWGKLSETTFGVGAKKQSALSAYDLEFARSLAVAESAEARNTDASIPAPAMSIWDADAKKCPTCEFKKICLEELITYKGSGHVSLLAGVTPKKIADQLQDLDSLAELAVVTSGTPFVEESAQRARVYLSGKHELKLGISQFDVPTFDIEIDIDLENSQGVLQDLGFEESVEPDRLYLYGYITHDRTVESDWAKSEIGTFENYDGTREGEHSVFLRMWEYLQTQIKDAAASGKSIGVFHYSSHELTWWKKWVRDFQDLPGTPTLDEVEEFIQSYCHDLLPVAKQVIFAANKKSPICNYSIKTLAPIAGFNWMLDDAGGANSLLKYREAVSSDSEKATAARDWLRQYNMDDVRATMALRNWLRTHKFYSEN